MSEPPPQRLSDDQIGDMLRVFQGPESPRRRPSASRVGRRRALLVAAAAAFALGTVGVAAWLLSGGSKPREASLARTGACSELRVFGRRYVARRLSPALLRRAGRLRSSAIVYCDGSTVGRARLVRLNGVRPAVALARAAAPGLVYVAAGSACLGARVEEELVACLGSGRS
jgi:hypothetical protein